MSKFIKGEYARIKSLPESLNTKRLKFMIGKIRKIQGVWSKNEESIPYEIRIDSKVNRICCYFNASNLEKLQ
jgi:hypothetical protein